MKSLIPIIPALSLANEVNLLIKPSTAVLYELSTSSLVLDSLIEFIEFFKKSEYPDVSKNASKASFNS